MSFSSLQEGRRDAVDNGDLGCFMVPRHIKERQGVTARHASLGCFILQGVTARQVAVAPSPGI